MSSGSASRSKSPDEYKRFNQLFIQHMAPESRMRPDELRKRLLVEKTPPFHLFYNCTIRINYNQYNYIKKNACRRSITQWIVNSLFKKRHNGFSFIVVTLVRSQGQLGTTKPTSTSCNTNMDSPSILLIVMLSSGSMTSPWNDHVTTGSGHPP